MADLSFIKEFEKDLGDLGSSLPPRYWFSSGNYVINKIISGSFTKGAVGQGRVTGLAGPSGAGKSFVLCNIMREAQKQGAYIVAMDSENALDDDFVSAIGVDPTDGYKYISVDTVPDCVRVVSSFITKYKKSYKKNDEDAPKVLFVLDSLDMLSTETELEQFEEGESKGDQGQRNKQLKKMLRLFVQAIKGYNISIVVTSQVYKNQDLLNGEGVWIVADAVRFSLSQIMLLTKLKLREGKGADRTVAGINMKVEGFKTRFTKPFQTVTVEVPYDSGMDPYNGLLDVAIELGIVERAGSWLNFNGEKYQGKDNFPPELLPDVLVKCEANTTKFLAANLEDMEEVVEDQPTSKSKRQKKHKKEE